MRNHSGHHINHTYVSPAVMKILSSPCFSWPYSGILGPVLTFQLSHLNEGSCNQKVEEAEIKIYRYKPVVENGIFIRFTGCKNLHSLHSLEPHGHQWAASPNFPAISRKHIGAI